VLHDVGRAEQLAQAVPTDWARVHAGVLWDVPLPPPVLLESLLETAATKWPDRTAIDFYDRNLTFRELHDFAMRAEDAGDFKSGQ
jgi:hypothetical protein